MDNGATCTGHAYWRTFATFAITLVACGLISGCQQRTNQFEALGNIPFEEVGWKNGPKDGRILRSDHYDIYTTLTDRRLLETIPQVMETSYAYYARLAPAVRHPSERLRLYMFATRGDWAYFTRRFAPRKAPKLLQIQRGGYTERGVCVFNYNGHAATFALAGHEGFHQYLHHCVSGRVPAWLNEGLAVWCEGQRWNSDGLNEIDPWYNPRRRNALAEALLREELLPLPELLRINAGHVIGGVQRKINTYYAQVWALVLFLAEGENGKYAADFQRMLEALGDDSLDDFVAAGRATSAVDADNFGAALFTTFFGDDLATIESEYLHFMRRRILGAVD